MGSDIEVTCSTNKSLVGVKFEVVDDIKNITMLDNDKMIQKNIVKIQMLNNIGVYELDGKFLIKISKNKLKIMGSKNE